MNDDDTTLHRVERDAWVWHLTSAGHALLDAANLGPSGWTSSLVKQNLQRTISRAVVNGTSVFVKRVRPNTPRSWLRELIRPPKAKLEFDNALALLACGIPTAEPLAWGRPVGSAPAESILVTRELSGESLADRLSLPLTPADRRELAQSLGRFYAQLATAGVSHPDPHPGNLFSLADGGFALLDLHAVRMHGGINLQAVRCELVLLNRFFQMRTTQSDRLRFWRAFVSSLPALKSVTGVASLNKLGAEIERQTAESNRRLWAARIKRHLGDNRETYRVTGLAARGWATRDLPVELVAGWLADPDGPFRQPDTKLFKDSRTSTVARVETTIGPVAYKRFNLKSPLLPLKAVFRRTPAVRSWLAGHGLRDRSLPTARPLACFQRCRFGVPTVGYLVCEWVTDAVELPDAVATLTQASRRELASALGRLVRRMQERGVSHRDLKAANVLVAGNQPILVDLVGVRAPVQSGRTGRELARLASSFVHSPHVSNGDRLRCLRAFLGTDASMWKAWWQTICITVRRKQARSARTGRGQC